MNGADNLERRFCCVRFLIFFTRDFFVPIQCVSYLRCPLIQLLAATKTQDCVDSFDRRRLSIQGSSYGGCFQELIDKYFIQYAVSRWRQRRSCQKKRTKTLWSWVALFMEYYDKVIYIWMAKYHCFVFTEKQNPKR